MYWLHYGTLPVKKNIILVTNFSSQVDTASLIKSLESALILLVFDMSRYKKEPLRVKKSVIEWAFSIRSKIRANEQVPIILIGTHLDCVTEGLQFSIYS